MPSNQIIKLFTNLWKNHRVHKRYKCYRGCSSVFMLGLIISVRKKVTVLSGGIPQFLPFLRYVVTWHCSGRLQCVRLGTGCTCSSVGIWFRHFLYWGSSRYEWWGSVLVLNCQYLITIASALVCNLLFV